MSFNFGGGKSKGSTTTTVALPGKSKNEERMEELTLQQMERAAKEQADFDASPLSAMQKQIEAKATENILARLEGRSPVLSPEESARLEKIFGTARSRGTEELTRFGRDTAAARGMTIGDAPVNDAVLQEKRKLEEGLGASQAQAELNLGDAEEIFNERLVAFQNNLQQQAFQNRMMMAGQANTFGNSMFSQRFNAAPKTTSGRKSGSNYSWGFDTGEMMGAASQSRGLWGG